MTTVIEIKVKHASEHAVLVKDLTNDIDALMTEGETMEFTIHSKGSLQIMEISKDGIDF